jgi:hypothetical protein
VRRGGGAWKGCGGRLIDEKVVGVDMAPIVTNRGADEMPVFEEKQSEVFINVIG